METLGKNITSVDDLKAFNDPSVVPESTVAGLLSTQLETTAKQSSLSPRTSFAQAKPNLNSAALAPQSVATLNQGNNNAALFSTLGIVPEKDLNLTQSQVLSRQSNLSLSPRASFTLGFDPFAPELELYSGSYDSFPLSDNDPFPTSLLATAPWNISTVPSFGNDSFVNGRGSSTGFKVSLQGNRVTTPSRTFRLATGYNNVAGTEARDSIRGNANDNRLFGFGGNDVITYSKGDDTISGGAGYDTMTYRRLGAAVTIGQFGRITKGGGNGVDSLQGDATNPLITTVERIIGAKGQANSVNVAGASSDVEVNLRAGYLNIASVTGGGKKGDFDIQNFVNATGGFGDDTLVGNNQDNVLVTGAVSSNGVADNDTVKGGLGSDRIVGGAGLDILSGGAGRDRFELGSSSEYYYRDAGSLGTNEYATLSDFQSGVDTLVLEGAASDYAFLGSSASNTLVLRDVDNSGGFSFSDDLVAYVPTGFADSDVQYV